VKLKILGSTWTVFEVTYEKLIQKTVELGYTTPDDDVIDYGCWEPKKQEIYIRNDIPADTMQEILHHEIGEIICSDLSITVGECDQRKPDEQEAQVDSHFVYTILMKSLFAALNDNGFVNVKMGKKKK